MNTVLNKIAQLVLLILLLPIFNRAQTIEIHQIDVGAGDAALINIRNNGIDISHSILIDAGDRFSTPTQAVINYLKANARQVGPQVYLDYIISSHYDADHIGGLVGTKKTGYGSTTGSKKRKCGADYFSGILDPATGINYYALLDKGDAGYTATSKLFDNYKALAGYRRAAVGSTVVGGTGALSIIAAPATPYLPPLAGTQALSLGGYIDLGTDASGVAIRLRLILADGRIYNPLRLGSVSDTGALKRFSTTYNDPNNWGLGWVLEYGAFKYYTAGDVAGYNTASLFDIETAISTALPNIYTVPAAAPGHICVQKISHHGSENSSNPVFLGTLKSSLGIISSGSKYRHPHQPVISRLESATWSAGTQLNNSNMAAYLMTELCIRDTMNRRVNLAKGATSGSGYWVASNPTVGASGYQYINPIDVSSTYTMSNGQNLYAINKVTVPNVSGNVVVKVNATNILTHSTYTVEYEKYNGAGPKLSRIINCHNQ